MSLARRRWRSRPRSDPRAPVRAARTSDGLNVGARREHVGLRLRGDVLLREVVRAAQVEPAELLQPLVVLGPQRGVAVSATIALSVLSFCSSAVASSATAFASFGFSSAFFCSDEADGPPLVERDEEVLRDVADPGRAGADAEEHEARSRTRPRGRRTPTWRDPEAAEEELILPALVLRLLRLRRLGGLLRQHSLSGGACGAAYLLPRVLSLAVTGVSVDDRLQDARRRAAEDGSDCWILDWIVRASGE